VAVQAAQAAAEYQALASAAKAASEVAAAESVEAAHQVEMLPPPRLFGLPDPRANEAPLPVATPSPVSGGAGTPPSPLVVQPVTGAGKHVRLLDWDDHTASGPRTQPRSEPPVPARSWGGLIAAAANLPCDRV
jgi:hypothetical protein